MLVTIAQDSSHPTGVVDTSPRGSSGAQRARERKAMAALGLRRAQSMDWDDIAEIVGYPTGRHALIAAERMLEEQMRTAEGSEFMRQMASDQLMDVLGPVLKTAKNPKDPNWLAAIDRFRLLLQQHTDLMGYAAPKRSINLNPTTAQIEKWFAEVTGMGRPTVQEADIFGDEDIVDAEVLEDGDDAVPN